MPGTLLDAIAALAQLRVEVEKILADGEWSMTGSHADAEAMAFMQLAVGDVAAIETLAGRDIRLVIAGTAAGRAAYEGTRRLSPGRPLSPVVAELFNAAVVKVREMA